MADKITKITFKKSINFNDQEIENLKLVGGTTTERLKLEADPSWLHIHVPAHTVFPILSTGAVSIEYLECRNVNTQIDTTSTSRSKKLFGYDSNWWGPEYFAGLSLGGDDYKGYDLQDADYDFDIDIQIASTTEIPELLKEYISQAKWDYVVEPDLNNYLKKSGGTLTGDLSMDAHKAILGKNSVMGYKSYIQSDNDDCNIELVTNSAGGKIDIKTAASGNINLCSPSGNVNLAAGTFSASGGSKLSLDSNYGILFNNIDPSTSGSGYYKLPNKDNSTSENRHTLATQEWFKSGVVNPLAVRNSSDQGMYTSISDEGIFFEDAEGKGPGYATIRNDSGSIKISCMDQSQIEVASNSVTINSYDSGESGEGNVTIDGTIIPKNSELMVGCPENEEGTYMLICNVKVTESATIKTYSWQKID